MVFPYLRLSRWLIIAALGVCAARAVELEPTFATDFDSVTAMVAGGSGEPIYDSKAKLTQGPQGAGAVQIPVGGHLVYDATGNVFISAGTLSFWWRPDQPVGRVAAGVVGVTSLQRYFFNRWLRIYTENGDLRVTLYASESSKVQHDKGTIPAAEDLPPRLKREYQLSAKENFQPGQWYHIAVTWDIGQGVALYVNGQLADAIDVPWFFGGNVNHLALGSGHSSSYTRPANAIVPQSFGPIRVYDRWLDADRIQTLYQGKAISKQDEDLAPLLEERARRLGLAGDLELPVIVDEGDDAIVWVKQLGLPQARDVMRTSYAGLDGDYGRAWPLYQGYSSSGQRLIIDPDWKHPVNLLQVMASGPMRFTLEQEGEHSQWLAIDSPVTQFHSGALTSEAAAGKIVVERENGLLFHANAFYVDQGTVPQDWQWFYLQEGSAFPWLDEFAPYDRYVLEVTDQQPKVGDAQVWPALHALHLRGPVAEEDYGLLSMMLDLAVDELPAGTEFSLNFYDPINYERRSAALNWRIQESESGRVRLVLDARDHIYRAGQQPWIVLYASEDLNIDLHASRIAFDIGLPAEAQQEYFVDQLSFVRDVFQELSEARPWSHDPDKLKWLRSLLNGIDALRAIHPDDPLVAGYWHWTHPRERTPELELPAVPEGAPQWAFYTLEMIDLLQQSVDWWIEYRMDENGEFGAPDGINDDTDLIQDWLAVDLMSGPNLLIREVVTKVANLSWEKMTVDGMSRQITDTLHMYEWGLNANTLAFVMHYGDPVYFERLLRFSRYYEDLMVELGESGDLHFKSWYFGASRIVTEGVYGQDRQVNALLLQPALLLAWYNGDPYALSRLDGWVRAMMKRVRARAEQTSEVPGVTVDIATGKTLDQRTLFGIGFPSTVWALYALTGDEDVLQFQKQMIDWEMTRRPLRQVQRNTSQLARYTQKTGDDTWLKKWQEWTEGEALWQRSLHNSWYRELSYFDVLWRLTGDDDWIDRGTHLALYHMLWSKPMLTEAEATTDRVWLPLRLAATMTLGDMTIVRNELWPGQIVSWENSSGEIAPLVRDYSEGHLVVELVNLSAHEATIDMRLWALRAGEYSVEQQNFSFVGDLIEKKQGSSEVQRYSLLPLTLEPNSKSIVKLQLKQATGDVRDRPDLAISTLDASFDKDESQWTVQVHNIGARSSNAFVVEASQAGRVIFSERFNALQPPADFSTHKQKVSIRVADVEQPLLVRVRSLGADKEITLHNNVITLQP